MAIRTFLFAVLFVGFLSGDAVRMAAQEGGPDSTVFRITVDMVQLNVAVTDSRGNYVTSLRPWDFAVSEDGVPQKVATFGEGNATPRRLAEFEPGDSKPKLVESYSAKIPGRLRDESQRGFMPEQTPEDRLGSLLAGASVF